MKSWPPKKPWAFCVCGQMGMDIKCTRRAEEDTVPEQRAHTPVYTMKKRNENEKKVAPRRKACNNIEPVWAIVQKCFKSTKAEISFAPDVRRAPASFVFFYFSFIFSSLLF